MEKRIKPGYGYWDTTKHPLGGKFCRAGESGVRIVKVKRSLMEFSMSQRRGCTEEGITEDGRTVAYDAAHTEEV